MKITVAICTWNRADLLSATLRRMESLNVPDDVEWELIVANNNCTDHTDEVIDCYDNRNLPIKKIFVPWQGHCHSRNAIIEAAQGDWILWTDDDVLVSPNWLAEYVQAIESNPEVSFMGGRIAPWFESPPPGWLERHFARLHGAFAVTPHSQKSGALSNEKLESIFGANMAIRTDVQRQFSFDTKLGLVGDLSVRGDETDLIKRLIANDHKGFWVEAAKVEHFIPTNRMTPKYLREFFFGYGQAQVRMNQPNSVATVLGWPRWAIRNWCESKLAAMSLHLFKNSMWLSHYRRAAICAGVLYESKKLHQRGQSR